MNTTHAPIIRQGCRDPILASERDEKLLPCMCNLLFNPVRSGETGRFLAQHHPGSPFRRNPEREK
jgi:hypothetical protein